MTATSFDPVPARLRARQATGYEPRFLSDELEQAPDEHSIFGAEGGLWSCVEDLARWLSCQFTGKAPGGKVLLREETLKEMHKPRYLVDDAWTTAWAIGWYAVRKDDVVWRMHSGGHYGFITNACFDPEREGRCDRAPQRVRQRDAAGDGARRRRTRGRDERRTPHRACGAAYPRRFDRSSVSTSRSTSPTSFASSGATASSRSSIPTTRRGPHARCDGGRERVPDRAGLPRVGRARPLHARRKTAA